MPDGWTHSGSLPLARTPERPRSLIEAPRSYIGILYIGSIDKSEAGRRVVTGALPIRWIAADPVGRLWIARGPGHMAAERVDLLSPEGRYLGTIEREVMPVAFVSVSRFLGLRLEKETNRPVLSLVELGESPVQAAREPWRGLQPLPVGDPGRQALFLRSASPLVRTHVIPPGGSGWPEESVRCRSATAWRGGRAAACRAEVEAAVIRPAPVVFSSAIL